MGVIVSRDADDSYQRHRAIEQEIKEDKKRSASIMKLLLLGARESGKSTIVKQMRILHGNGFEQEEFERQKCIIFQNVICAVASILRAMKELGIEFDNLVRETEAAVILQAEESWKPGSTLSFHEWACIKLLWSDSGLQTCFARANEYQLCDSAKYFLDDINRISSRHYVPSYGDLLRAREGTLGIVEFSFALKNMTLRLIDVGGQRSERKKWIHCFEDVNCVIFVASLSEYNQTLFEDHNMNRMQESLKLFEAVCNCRWFVNAAMMLFLNKRDIFSNKLKSFPLTLCFPEYNGPNFYDECVQFIECQYEKQNRNKSKVVYCHKTCATDTNNVQFVMDASLDIVLSKNMAEVGLTLVNNGPPQRGSSYNSKADNIV